jgi:hypothetical protein
MSESQPTIVVIAPGERPLVYTGTWLVVRAALERLGAAWGRTRTAVDARRRALVAVDGRAAFLRHGYLAEPAPAFASLGWSGNDPGEVYLLADRASAAFALGELGPGALFVPLLAATDLAPKAARVPLALAFGPTPDTGMPRGDLLCPHCHEQRLHADAVFDARSHRDGARICNPCGILEVLRAEESRRQKLFGEDR